jgi:diguanylate cyclase (GGDEF)-like protein
MAADPQPTPLGPVSLRRRLLVFAVAVLAPVAVGAVVTGLVLFSSTARSDRLAEEMADESAASVGLFKDLQAARLAGSGFMEEGDREDLAGFRAAERRVDAKFEESPFDEGDERVRLRGIEREWRAAVRQLRETPTGISTPADNAEDPEDVFEAHVNSAIGGVERLVEESEGELRADLVAARRLNRTQAIVAIVALLASLGLAAVLARRLAGRMLRPIRRLTRAARAFGSGHLGHRVSVTSSAELQEMAETFNGMAEALQEQHSQLERQAFTDSLTGIANRALFEDRAAHAIERSAGSRERVAVLMVDLDDFKLVNDGMGHASGDELIRLVAERISAAARPSDTVARLGGDEFAVLLEGVRGLDDALGVAERLRQQFDRPFHLDGADVVVSASVGVAMSGGSATGTELLRRADLAMYRVKDRGKNATAFFDPAMEERAIDRLDVLGALRKALESDELVAHYQPIVELETGTVVGAEALLRWERPGQGLVAPLDFIPLAEETGLILPVGAWILREACTQAREWREQGAPDVPVGVNVSARQLIDPDFERMVEETLAETRLPGEALVLEVTESSVMQNPELTIPKLERIVDQGIRLTLDDFGEGYSSLSHIRRLPVHGLKIAMPFVRELGDPDGDPRLVRGIIELAHMLELALVAEGVETPEQRDALRSFGCPYGQGFLFARPLELSALRALLLEKVIQPARGR